jgi:CheY-like chemotaxis protein
LALLTSEMARSDEYCLLRAANGTEALSQLVGEAPDLIIAATLDDMDRLAFCRRVQVLTGSAVPLILLSPNSDLDECLEGLHAGADDWIVAQAVTPQELAARAAAVLNRVARTRAEEGGRFDALRARTMQEVATRLSQPIDDLMLQLNRLSAERINGDPDLQRRCLMRAIEDTQSMKRIVDDMGWASAEGAETSLNSEPVRIAPIVRRSAATASRRAVDRNVQLSLSCGGLLTGNVDEGAMVRTLGSLLEAVVDLSPSGAEVSLQARRVRDLGLEFVISEGNRETSSADTPETLQHALELARSVVRGHNGKLSVRRTEDGRQAMCCGCPAAHLAPTALPAKRSARSCQVQRNLSARSCPGIRAFGRASARGTIRPAWCPRQCCHHP